MKNINKFLCVCLHCWSSERVKIHLAERSRERDCWTVVFILLEIWQLAITALAIKCCYLFKWSSFTVLKSCHRAETDTLQVTGRPSTFSFKKNRQDLIPRGHLRRAIALPIGDRLSGTAANNLPSNRPTQKIPRISFSINQPSSSRRRNTERKKTNVACGDNREPFAES